jgi:multicomponent K+:H+ antiporter subunit D
VLSDLFGRQRGENGDALREGPPVHRGALLGLAFLFAAATIAGMPPSTGFLGKLMVLQSVRHAPETAAIWAIVLVTSFLMVVGCARAGSLVLWKVAGPQARASATAPRTGEWVALAALIGCSSLLAVLAEPAKQYVDATAAQLTAPSRYVQAVLGNTSGDLVRPLPAAGTR